jgi:hypothetical protein
MKLFEVTFEKTDICPAGVSFRSPIWVVAPTEDFALAAAGNQLGWATAKVTELGDVHQVVTCRG